MAESNLLITNATLVTWGSENQLLSDHAVRVEGDRITAMGPSAALRARYPAAEQIDAGGQLLMPGNICAHTHFYGAFARGMAIPGDAPRDFPEILVRLWWKLDKALTMDDVRASAEVFMVDAIRNGTTTLIDHHASPNAIDGSLDTIAGVVDAAGLRACLCYEVSDRDGEAKLRAGISENARFIRRIQAEAAWPGRLGCMRACPCPRRRWPLAGRPCRMTRVFTFTWPSMSRTNMTASSGRVSGWSTGWRGMAFWGRARSPPIACTWTRARPSCCATAGRG